MQPVPVKIDTSDCCFKLFATSANIGLLCSGVYDVSHMRSIFINKFCLSSSDRPPISVSKSAMSRGGAEIFDAWKCLFFLGKNRCFQVSKILALFTSWIYGLKFAFQKMKEKSTYLPVRARVSRARMGVSKTFADC